MFPPVDQLTTDGYDLQFGTNVIGRSHLDLILPAQTQTDIFQVTSYSRSSFSLHFSLERKLLRTSTPESLLRPPRVLTCTLSTLIPSRTDLHERNWVLRSCTSRVNSYVVRYPRKIRVLYLFPMQANAIFARELARRYGHEGIISISCNPGT